MEEVNPVLHSPLLIELSATATSVYELAKNVLTEGTLIQTNSSESAGLCFCHKEVGFEPQLCVYHFQQKWYTHICGRELLSENRQFQDGIGMFCTAREHASSTGQHLQDPCDAPQLQGTGSGGSLEAVHIGTPTPGDPSLTNPKERGLDITMQPNRYPQL